MPSRSQVANPLRDPFLFSYQLVQWGLDRALSPRPPPHVDMDNYNNHNHNHNHNADNNNNNNNLVNHDDQDDHGGHGDSSTLQRRPRVAIVGAGITGVTAAAHVVGHGFDVVLFEAGGKENLGGIWSKVNDSSGLQIHSLMYRFHPSVRWEQGYPDRGQILSQVRQLWKRYGLHRKTRFHTPVHAIRQDEDDGRWIVNDAAANGKFEGVIVAVGTCGAPKMVSVPGMDGFKGPVLHSSDLTGKSARNKSVSIIGSGASAVEALEWALATGASSVSLLGRSDKWLIPRNIVVNALLSFNIFDRETFLSRVPEFLLKRLFYRDLADDLAPDAGEKGLFTDTPVVNSDVLPRLRDGSARWVRCDIENLTSDAVVVNRRERGVPKGGPGHREIIPSDVVVMATGFHRPSLTKILPGDCFHEPYTAPNWYLQTFPPNHPSLAAVNCTYVAGIGSVGNWHIGIYTRVLLMFLVDPLTRPSPFWMWRWIDMTRLLNYGSPVGAFDFFTYLELLWFAFCVVVNPFRWKWAVFVLFGVGLALPRAVVRREERLLNGDGYRFRDRGSSI